MSKRRIFIKQAMMGMVGAGLARSAGVTAGVDDDPAVFDIRDFGALGDGVALNTVAIQNAVDAAHARAGGGRVVITGGTYLSGTIELKSNVELYVDANATLLGSTRIGDYRRTANAWLAFIMASDAQNIALTGRGKIDGQGRELALAVNFLHHSGEQVDPEYGERRQRPNEKNRPQLVEMTRCKGVTVKDLEMRNAASWVQTYDQCDQLGIERIRVNSRAYWNNDGMDIVDCSNVRIVDCDVNTADDGICLKSHSEHSTNDQVHIARCTIRSSASAIKFGTASRGGFRNVTIEDIKVFDTFRSAIALECVDGGVLENVTVRNIEAVNTGNALFIRLGHRNSDGPIGKLRNVTINGLKVEVPFLQPDMDYDLHGPATPSIHNVIPASIVGLPDHPVENLRLENIEVSYPGRSSKGMAYIPLQQLFRVPEKAGGYPEFSMFGELPAWGLYVRHVAGIQMNDIRLSVADAEFRPAYVFDDVHRLEMKNSRIDIESMESQVALNNVHDARFSDNVTAGKKDNSLLQIAGCSGIEE